MENSIRFTRVNNCVNGNPRYVFHFIAIADDYDRALALSRRVGGKKYYNKKFGGGIIVESYNIQDTQKLLLDLKEN